MDEKQELQFRKTFDSLVSEAWNLCFLPRSSQLQQLAIKALEKFRDEEVLTAKKRLCAAGNDAGARTMLYHHSIVDAMVFELAMWMELNNQDHERAWRYLVAAQAAVRGALNARPQSKVNMWAKKLRQIETCVFPPMLFFSIGITAHERTCSICETAIESCDHVPGRIYGGEFCRLLIPTSTQHECSVVLNPENKACIALRYDFFGDLVNAFTWEVTEDERAKDDEGSDGHIIEAIVTPGLLQRVRYNIADPRARDIVKKQHFCVSLALDDKSGRLPLPTQNE
ncbi:hypothetical protein [Rhodopirellula bahusiensis]|uniref:hypothetical protein n=1 Tax=Rhodopirellula bahusiensis TaxID=2014065 RepID=UPI0032641EFC